MRLVLLAIALLLAFATGWIASRVYWLWDYIEWHENLYKWWRGN